MPRCLVLHADWIPEGLLYCCAVTESQPSDSHPGAIDSTGIISVLDSVYTAFQMLGGPEEFAE